MEEFEEFVPLTPVNFFQIQAEFLPLKGAFPTISTAFFEKFRLPDLSSLNGETSFAEVAAGWSSDGLEFHIQIGQPFARINFPDVTRGDSVELFLDTRDVKTSGFNTRFCHHFYFLPEAHEGVMAGEITRFRRVEDAHDLCKGEELIVKPNFKRSSYTLQIFIPSSCLQGYDPEQFNRLGFSYRINRDKGYSQHFSSVTTDYQVEQQPSTWSSVKLLK